MALPGEAKNPIPVEFQDDLDEHQTVINFLVARKRGEDPEDGCVTLVSRDDHGNKIYVKAFQNRVPEAGGAAARRLRVVIQRLRALENRIEVLEKFVDGL